MTTKKIVVVGGGPGGYVAAIRAAQLGADTTLIERNKIGGVCLNVGCIPTKVLLHTAHEFLALRTGAIKGLSVDKVQLDWQALQEHKDTIVSQLTGGVEGILKQNGVKILQGTATLQADASVLVDGKEALQADAVILAVGSTPTAPTVPGLESPRVIDSTGALSLPKVPGSLVVWGVGVVALEFASVYNALGSQVTVIGRRPGILKEMDARISRILKKSMENDGITFLSKSTVKEVKECAQGLAITVETGEENTILEAEILLAATGRKINSEGLGLEALPLRMQNNWIEVDENFLTSMPRVYAIGDCNGQSMLAHAASAQGIAAVERILGHPAVYHDHAIPGCVYTAPEIGAIGLTEEEAKERSLDYYSGSFPLSANGKSIIEGSATGLVKLLFLSEDDTLIGAHIIGPSATEMIAELSLAMSMQATADDLLAAIHPHPTVCEAIAEAAMDAKGQAIHRVSGRRR